MTKNEVSVEVLKQAVSGQGRKIHQILKENRKLRIMLRELTKIMVQDSKNLKDLYPHQE